MAKQPALALLVCSLALVACGESYPTPSTPSLLDNSTYSGPSSGSFSVPSSPSLPQQSARGDLIVKPDLVCVPFVLRTEVFDSKAGLELLQLASSSVTKRFEGATGGASKTKMLGATVHGVSHSKVSSSDGKPTYVVTVDGFIETPFATDADYWSRARLVASLVTASNAKEPLVPVAGEGQAEIDAAFGSPELKLRDPESYRAELVKRWVERARGFADAADSQAAPLEIVNCEPPSTIAVSPISVEQIALSLPVQCRIDLGRNRAN